MRIEAVHKAERELGRARLALDTLRGLSARGDAEAIAEIVNAWADALTHGNRVYGALEQGAKNTSSGGWFGNLKRERKEDPLLQYVHQARDADEHGLEKVADPEHHSQSVTMPPGGHGKPFVQISSPTGLLSDAVMTPLNGAHTTDTWALKDVTSRGRTYGPPTQHLGSPLAEVSPLSVAELFVGRLEQILVEARSRASGADTVGR